MSQVRPFPVDARLTGIALAYTNQALIADLILPRVPVGGPTFKYLEYNRDTQYTPPSTLVGRKGRPNEVEFGATEKPGQVFDYGLDDVIPNDDITAAPPGFDPVGVATQGLTDLVLLDREVRVANLVFNANTYPTANKDTLTAGEFWDDPDANPVEYILDTLSGMLVRPNTAVFSRRVFDRLRSHPKVVAAVHASGGNAATGGYVSAQQLADLLDLRAIRLGEAFVNTAKPGQTAALSRAWGNHAAFLHINPLSNTRSPQMSFGITAQWQGRVAGQMSEPLTGLRGSVRVRVGESVGEIITAADAGFFVQNAIDPA